MSMRIEGQVIAWADGYGKNKILVIRRAPTSKWETDHTDRLEIPIEVSPWMQGKLTPPEIGAWADCEIALQGREWNGKRFLSAHLVDLRIMGAAAGSTPAAAVPEGIADPVTDDHPF